MLHDRYSRICSKSKLQPWQLEFSWVSWEDDVGVGNKNINDKYLLKLSVCNSCKLKRSCPAAVIFFVFGGGVGSNPDLLAT